MIKIIFLSLFLTLSCQSQKKTPRPVKKSGNLASLSQEKAMIKTVHGPIKFAFYSNAAPNTVTRIKQLIQEGFYNGLTFHRVVPGFVIQGGDPQGTGRGGSGKNLKAEFSSVKHQLGTVAMARSQNPDSADSQFYICTGNCSHLDGSYTVFGLVTSGIENVQKISQGDKMLSVVIQN